jgi:glycine betaine/proline transport system substrate-binding protein
VAVVPVRALTPLLALVLLAVACTGDGGDQSGDGSASTEAADTLSPRGVRKRTIRLGVTDWTGARVNAAIAEQLIERRLGYPVESVEVIDLRAMIADLRRGELDAVLELWPSSLRDSEWEAIESADLTDLGELGVEAKIGWYVPRYVVEGGVDGLDPIDDWSGLTDPAVAAAFASPATGSQGRFLGTDPAYEQADEELIETLGLPFEIEYSGSDGATEAAVAEAVEAGRPILLYWWSPTALVARYDLVNLPLPERTPDCVAEIEAGSPARCDYPVDRLLKIGAPDLAATAPEVHAFLSSLRLTIDDQLELIDQIDNGGRDVDAAAADWIAANAARWEAWFG